MPKISKQKIEKISEQILSYLYSIFPKQIFTSDVAKELARDEEFMKTLLIDLQKKTTLNNNIKLFFLCQGLLLDCLLDCPLGARRLLN